MSYSRTLEYLYSQLPMFQRIGAAAYKADLGKTMALTRILGNPERNFPSVHIAGTNGKGSVSHMLASILQEEGYKTALYTSPHLKDFRERIRINGDMVPENYVTRFVEKYKDAFKGINPSFFEYTAAMAFTYFAENNVDLAIMETGMGGRLDSTNVISPVLCVITNISHDHTAFLGASMPEIAREKAGIIKTGVPVIIGETQQEVSHIFHEKARESNAPILFADQLINTSRSSCRNDQYSGICWNIFKEGNALLEGIKCPLKGNYQEKNIKTLMAVIEQLKKLDIKISNKAVEEGMEKVIENTGLLGRWQVLGTQPQIICDVGHNEAGIRCILEQLKEENYRQLHWVIGMVNDKETGKILGLLPSSARYYFCRANIPRGMDAGELHLEAEKYGLIGDSYPSVMAAYSAARTRAHPKDMIFIGGSTFIVAEVL